MKPAWLRVSVAAGALALVLAGCDGGDESDLTTPDELLPTETDEPEEPGETEEPEEVGGATLDVTVTEDGIDGLPGQIPGGLVTVNLGIEPPADPDLELDFSRVAGGTSVQDFTEGLASIIRGGAFPDFMEGNAGVGAGEYSILLEPGSYFVWFEKIEAETEEGGEEAGDDEEEAPPEFVVVPLTVTDSEDDGELPETDGTITAVDYGFEVDVQAGDSFTFRNDSSEQFHHAILFNFGTLDPETVEENLPAFLQGGEEEPPPPAFADLDFETLEGGHSGVFGPGGAGTAIGVLQSGNTYAAVCFIQDRAGGPPHAIAHDMYTVFQVD